MPTPKPLLNKNEAAFLLRQARAELARRYAKEGNILKWGQILFPNKFRLSFCQELHQYFVDIQDEPFTNTEAPRGFAKTTIKCFLIPIFNALVHPLKYIHFLNIQSTEDKALSVNVNIRSELELNEELKAIYGDQVGKLKWSDGQFVLKNGVVFSAAGAGQSIRGINFRNIRPDYVMVDDLYDDKDINNPESTQKKNDWFWSDLYKCMSQNSRNSLHVQGTAINQYDLLEQLKKNPSVKSKTFRAIKDWDKKKVLWPDIGDFEKIMVDRERMGTIIFDRELQNTRRDEASSIIKNSYLENWEYDPIELNMRLLKDENFYIKQIVLGNDPSIGKDKESDDSGFVVVIETGYRDGEGSEFWIYRVDMEPLSLESRIQKLIEIRNQMPETMPINRVKIEAISGFDDYASEAIRRTNLPIERVSFVKDKITTLINKSHFFENHKVHINKNISQEMKNKLRDQLTTNYPKHDDGRDALLLCLEDQPQVSITMI